MNGKLWPKERDAQLRELHKQGLTYGRIAAELGVTRGAVASVVGRLGLAARPGGARPKFVQKEEQPRARSTGFQVLVVREGLRLGPQVALALFDLQPHHCRWPVNDAPYMFCGGARDLNSSYCERHHRISKRGVANSY